MMRGWVTDAGTAADVLTSSICILIIRVAGASGIEHGIQGSHYGGVAFVMPFERALQPDRLQPHICMPPDRSDEPSPH